MVGAAVILAAGVGERLRDVWPDRPKGLLEVGGETLVGRSARALRERGVGRILLVVGYRAEDYRSLAAGVPGLELVPNPGYAGTGSMASLDLALARLDADALVLESDLFYDPLALDALLGRPEPDAVLASAPTGAGDEVWVEAPDGRVRGLSKDGAALRSQDGEYVGVLRVSRPAARLFRETHARLAVERGDAGAAYDTDALPRVAGLRPFALCLVPDLLWGEIDVPSHLRRVRDVVFPAWAARQGGAPR